MSDERKPRRIQRRRTKGWRMPEGAVYVGRGSRWGNPYRVVPVHRSGPFDIVIDDWFCGQSTGIETARLSAKIRFRQAQMMGWHSLPDDGQIRAELAGRDLMCWCPLDQPCHADVLLGIANGDSDV